MLVKSTRIDKDTLDVTVYTMTQGSKYNYETILLSFHTNFSGMLVKSKRIDEDTLDMTVYIISHETHAWDAHQNIRFWLEIVHYG